MIQSACRVVALFALGCACSSRTVSPPPIGDGPGRTGVDLSWRIVDLAGGALTCDAVLATRVAIAGLGALVDLGEETETPCSLGASFVPVAVGGYDVSASLAGDDVRLATRTAHVDVTSASIASLALQFVVDTRAVLSFTLRASGKIANCTPASRGGAQMSTDVITITHTGDGCAPVALARVRPGFGPTMYQINCGAPASAPCIESDEQLATVTGIDPGSYTIHVIGRANAAQCWRADQIVLVPPARQTAVDVELGPQPDPGCP